VGRRAGSNGRARCAILNSSGERRTGQATESDTMSEPNDTNTTDPAPQPERISPGLWAVRYGIGIVMIGAGIVLLAVSPGSTKIDGFAMAVGGGLSVLLLNGLYRLGVSGDEEREQHEEAWRHYEEHGEWPDDPAPRQRTWVLPRGAVTFEDEMRAKAKAQAEAEAVPVPVTAATE
jgi:hypothetical protein